MRGADHSVATKEGFVPPIPLNVQCSLRYLDSDLTNQRYEGRDIMGEENPTRYRAGYLYERSNFISTKISGLGRGKKN